MARIELDDIAHRYGPARDGAWALDQLSLDVADGRAFAILGPSGCGKTTLLKIVSGLLRPTSGQVRLDGQAVNRLAPRERRVAQVFQFPVVYETMTVEENLAFPMRNERVPSDEIRRRVATIAELLDLGPLLTRRAGRLRPDEQQTVSLGRGLARPDVAALLLDEPLTVVDPARRFELRQKLRRVHRATRTTLVYVTHDQTEALTFADEVAVMDGGRVLQVASPRELFERPSHTFVGHFIGSPGMNLLPCRLDGREVVVDEHRIPVAAGDEASSAVGDTLELGIRPEFLELVSQPVPGSAPVRVQSVLELGDHRVVRVGLGRHQLGVRVPDRTPIPTGSGWLRFPPERMLLYRDGRLVR